MGRRTIGFLLALCLLWGMLPWQAAAAEEPAFYGTLTAREGKDGDAVDLILSYDGSLGKIGTFLVEIQYDEGRFQYQRVRESETLQAGVTTTAASPGQVATVYTAFPHEDALELPEESLTYRFQLLEGAQGRRTSRWRCTTSWT